MPHGEAAATDSWRVHAEDAVCWAFIALRFSAAIRELCIHRCRIVYKNSIVVIRASESHAAQVNGEAKFKRLKWSVMDMLRATTIAGTVERSIIVSVVLGDIWKTLMPLLSIHINRMAFTAAKAQATANVEKSEAIHALTPSKSAIANWGSASRSTAPRPQSNGVMVAWVP